MVPKQCSKFPCTDIVLFGVISQALRIDGPAQGLRKRLGEPVTRGIAALDRRKEVAVNVPLEVSSDARLTYGAE